MHQKHFLEKQWAQVKQLAAAFGGVMGLFLLIGSTSRKWAHPFTSAASPGNGPSLHIGSASRKCNGFKISNRQLSAVVNLMGPCNGTSSPFQLLGPSETIVSISLDYDSTPLIIFAYFHLTGSCRFFQAHMPAYKWVLPTTMGESVAWECAWKL